MRKRLVAVGATLLTCPVAVVASTLIVLFPSIVFAQGGIRNDSVLRADGRPAIGATVRVCTEAASGTPCSPTASIFSDKALSISKTNPIAVDSAAAFTYYASPGFYKEQLCLGATCVTRIVLMPADVGNFIAGTQNNRRNCDSFSGADAGAKIATCIADLPAGGGIADARGFQGAQVIAATIAITKPTEVLLDAATFTSSAFPIFSFDAGSDGSSLICTAAAKVTFANGIANFARLIRITGTSKITIRGCELDGNGNNALAGEQNHNIIITGSSTDVLITENSIHDAQGDSILIGDAERVVISRNFFYNIGRQGVTLFGPTINGITVSDNDFRVGTAVSTSTTSTGSFVHGEGAIASGAGNDTVVSDNRMDEIGISFTTSGDPWKKLTITGNTLNSALAGDPLITLQEAQDFSITGNTLIGDVTKVRSGIRVFDVTTTADTGRGVISGNTILNMGANAITLTGTGTAVPTLGSLVVSNNIIDSPVLEGISVEVQVPKLVISGNVIRNVGTDAIEIVDGLDYIISGNQINDPASDGIIIRFVSDASARGLIFGNSVFNTSTSGKRGIVIGSNANIDRILIFGNDVADNATPLSLGALATNVHAYMNRTATSGPPVWTSELELDGDLNHDGTNAGFFGVAPVARPGATDEIKAALALLGLLTDAGVSPLDLDGGLLTAGGVVATAGVVEYTDAPTLAASTTPSVTGGNVFLTNGTASITDFTGEQNGQVIILLCGADTTTSLLDATPLFLSAAFTCTADDTITLISNGTVWYEVSRSVN